MVDSTRELLHQYEPIFFNIILTLILILIACNLHAFVKFIKETFSKKQLITLIASILGLTLFTALIAPKTERILFDEDIYMNTAQNIVAFGRNQYCYDGEIIYGEYKCTNTTLNKQPPGYPMTLSLFFRVFDVSRSNAFLFNNIIFLINVSLIFFSVLTITKNYKISLFSMLLYTSVPVVAHWHNTAASEPVSAMYTTATLLSFLIFDKRRKLSLYFLSVLLLVLSVYTRFEAILLALPIIYLLFNFLKGLSGYEKKDFFKILGITSIGIAFLFPIVVHYFHVKSDPWGAEPGETFGLQYFNKNFSTNIKFFTSNQYFPIIALALLVGIIISKRSKILEYYILSFLLIFGVYLFFYAGSYEYGADIRYALTSLSPYVIACSIGLATLVKKFSEKNILLFVVIPLLVNMSLLIPSMRVRGEEGWQAWWDIEFIQNEIKTKLGPDDIIFSTIPYAFHVDKMNGRSTDHLYNQQYISTLLELDNGQRYYFHYGFWCALEPTEGSVAKFCNDIVLENYELEPVIEHERRGTRYALYEIVGVRTINPEDTPE